MLMQWAVAIGLAYWLSPLTWIGRQSETHVHVWAAIFLGGAITLPAIFVAYAMPGERSTRMAMACAQMCWSGLLIHLTGGRVETHFHIFGSLALLAFYRDLVVLLPATLIVAADHWVRGIYWPESIYGIPNPEWWRFLEHAGWVVFIDLFLIQNCRQSRLDLRSLTERQAQLELHERTLEEKVRRRTAALAAMQLRLQHAQKLESIGQLAAGIAHEINSPVQYITDNVRFLAKVFDGLLKALDTSGRCVQAARAGNLSEGEIRLAMDARNAAQLDFVRNQAPKALEQTLEGLERVAKIVRAMKEFSHPSQGMRAPTDLNAAIDATLTVARGEWKYVAELELRLDPCLPHVPCLRDEFNQVILNLVVNAAHAIEEAKEKKSLSAMGTITVTTRCIERVVEIVVQDTGIGMNEAVKQRVFDPFYTTKGVGKGTGQGLAIAHSVIVKQHGGTINVASVAGQGTTFTITLPLDVDVDADRSAA